jgi:integrase
VKNSSSKRSSTKAASGLNDAESRHRTVPIKETISAVGGGYPNKLVVFKIPASRYWWCRYFTGSKVVKESTKTENKSQAITHAKKFYETILLRERNLLPIGKSSSFERFANELLIEQDRLIKRGDRNPLLNVNDKQKLNHDLLPFFRDFKINEISYKHINQFVDTLTERSLSSSSIKNHLNLLHKILQLALREGAISNIPTFPKIKIKDYPRGWFTSEEYEYLREVATELADQQYEVRGHIITEELRLIITFMVNTFLRPSDLKELKHRNIQVVYGEHSFLRITPDTSKTENTPVISMAVATKIYDDVIEFQKSQSRGVSKDDFVFFPHLRGENSKNLKGKDNTNRDYALQTIRRQFEELLKISELKHTPSGQPRTLYSLRHTAIMFRLIKGDKIDSLTLAKNARTSVEMLERFYAKHLTAEMNVDKLHSIKKRKGYKEKDSRTKN